MRTPRSFHTSFSTTRFAPAGKQFSEDRRRLLLAQGTQHRLRSDDAGPGLRIHCPQRADHQLPVHRCQVRRGRLPHRHPEARRAADSRASSATPCANSQLSIGKKNFFHISARSSHNEEKLAQYTGRFARSGRSRWRRCDAGFSALFHPARRSQGLLGPPSGAWQACISIGRTCSGAARPGRADQHHGEAGQFFRRSSTTTTRGRAFGLRLPGNPTRFDDQVDGRGLPIRCFGIPVLYYGTEQGLARRRRQRRERPRGAVGQTGDAFDTNNSVLPQPMQESRRPGGQPALRYGRQYFRPISGSGVEFGVSAALRGSFRFRRILNDTELVVLANASRTAALPALRSSTSLSTRTASSSACFTATKATARHRLGPASPARKAR